MPYNTRRKSLSLPSLGIHIPITLAERATAAAAAAAASAGVRAPNPGRRNGGGSLPDQSHPSKKLKRSNATTSLSHSDDGLSCRASVRAKSSQSQERAQPPPPPVKTESIGGAKPTARLPWESSEDNVVGAVLAQLKITRNRPQQALELASALTQNLSSVRRSTNPSAMISSRLTTYLRRPCWTPLFPCPLTKGVDARHPRRPYYYLTSSSRLNSPPTELLRRINLCPVRTPSGTLSLSGDPEADQAMSRTSSPDIDLSPPPSEIDDDDISFCFIPHNPFLSPHVFDESGSVPSLEKDEKEFTQTADVLQKRKLDTGTATIEMDEWSRDESQWEESKCPPGQCVSIALHAASSPPPSRRPSSSYGLKKEPGLESWTKLERLVECDCYPETIDLEELDLLLGNP